MTTELETVIQGLECCLCFNILEEPKLLSCTHSFCEKCLHHLHNSHGKGIELSCPLCRQITQIGIRGVSSLKTNVPLKSMVGDLKTNGKLCTLCDPEAKSKAIIYCQECDEYMCDACLKGHAGFRKNASHVVVSVDDINNGKVKVKQMCHTHPGEERLWVCTSCKVSICFRCRMLDHNGPDHLVQGVGDFKKNMKNEIESLRKRGVEKMARIKSFTKEVRVETAKVEAIIAKREVDIIKTFDETFLRLNARKNALLDQCNKRKRKLTKELCNLGKNGEELIASISSACELVGNGVKALLEGKALVVHSNLCRELKDMLDRDDPDESRPKKIKSQAEAVTFTPCRLDDEHNVGMLNMNDWKLEMAANFHLSIMFTSMAPTKDGKMLVGYLDEGIDEFTVSGATTTVLEDGNVRNVCALSDGRFVVRDEKISLYSFDGNKLDTKEFEMIHTRYLFESGGMDVDKYNNIYVGYSHVKTIHVFTPEGGAPIREIPYQGYSPNVVCTMNHSNLLVVSDRSSVQVIDQQGRVKHDFTKESYHGKCLSVLHDDGILIGLEKDGNASIDLYTNQLKYVRTVIAGLNCGGHCWALREFSSGEIAFGTESKFYILRKC